MDRYSYSILFVYVNLRSATTKLVLMNVFETKNFTINFIDTIYTLYKIDYLYAYRKRWAILKKNSNFYINLLPGTYKKSIHYNI